MRIKYNIKTSRKTKDYWMVTLTIEKIKPENRKNDTRTGGGGYYMDANAATGMGLSNQGKHIATTYQPSQLPISSSTSTDSKKGAREIVENIKTNIRLWAANGTTR